MAEGVRDYLAQEPIVNQMSEGLEIEWYTIIDPSAMDLPGIICYPQSRDELETMMRIAGGGFKLICVWAEIWLCGPERTDDIRADGLVIVVDNPEETAYLEAQQIQGPYGHYGYRTSQMSQDERIRYHNASQTNETTDGNKLDDIQLNSNKLENDEPRDKPEDKKSTDGSKLEDESKPEDDVKTSDESKPEDNSGRGGDNE